MDAQQIETLIQKEARIKELEQIIFDSQQELNTVREESINIQNALGPLLQFGKSYGFSSVNGSNYLFTRNPSGVYVTLSDELNL